MPRSPLCGRELVLPKLASEFDQTAHRNSRWPLGDPRFVFFHPGCACNIEMDPRGGFCEFAQERGCGACASPASPGVHEVCDARTRHVEILIIDGQAPHILARFRE